MVRSTHSELTRHLVLVGPWPLRVSERDRAEQTRPSSPIPGTPRAAQRPRAAGLGSFP